MLTAAPHSRARLLFLLQWRAGLRVSEALALEPADLSLDTDLPTLRALVSKGRAAAYKQTHARILLLSNEGCGGGGLKDEEIGRSLQVGTVTVERVRRRCVEEGVAAALGRKEQLNRRPKKLDGQGEAHLIALACAEPPEGRAGWRLKLLGDRLVQWEIVESISPETVRQTLKKTNSSPG